MIFNSLGSNYDFKLALRHLLRRGKASELEALRDYLNHQFGGISELYAQGRAALARAVSLTDSPLVIVNGLTCYSVELAVRAAGAKAIFAELEPAGYHFGLDSLQQTHQANPTAKAVIVQANYGLPIAIKSIQAYCHKHGLKLIEDLAHSVGMNYSDGPAAGSVGDLVMLSFGRDKHIDSAGGGALVIRNRPKNYSSPSLRQQSLKLSLLDRLYPILSWLIRCSRGCCWLRGLHRLFSSLRLVRLTGGSPVMQETTLPSYKAQLVLEQLLDLKTEQKRRVQLWRAYGLAKLPQGANPLRCPVQLSQDPNLTLARLTKAGYNLVDQWAVSPVYPSRYLKLSDYLPGSCPRSEGLGFQLLELPLHRQVSPEMAKQMAKIINSKASSN